MSNSATPGTATCQAVCCSLPAGVCSNSCSLSQWCYLTISFSATPFSLCLESFLDQGLFQWVSSSHQVAKVWELQLQHQVLPTNIQGWFPLGLTGLISLQSKELSRVFSSTTMQKHWFFGAQSSLWSNSHICMWLQKKTIDLTKQTFVSRVMSLLFNTLSSLVIAFLPRSKHLLISWLQSPTAVILEPKKITSVILSTFSLQFAMKWWDCMPWF